MRKVKGSITVEASLVMSITLFILFSFIILTLLLHDRVVVTAALQEAAELGRQKTSGELGSLSVKNPEPLYAAKGQLAEFELREDGAVISWSSERASLYPGGGIWFNEKIERTYYDPPAFLRMCRIAEQVINAEH